MTKPEILYRIEDRLLYDGGRMVIEKLEYHVIRRTPKGAWIGRNPGPPFPYGKDRFVLDGPGKRFAYPTLEAAIESYKIRKFRQIEHLERGLIQAKAAKRGVESESFKVDHPFFDETLRIFHEYR